MSFVAHVLFLGAAAVVPAALGQECDICPDGVTDYEYWDGSKISKCQEAVPFCEDPGILKALFGDSCESAKEYFNAVGCCAQPGVPVGCTVDDICPMGINKVSVLHEATSENPASMQLMECEDMIDGCLADAGTMSTVCSGCNSFKAWVTGKGCCKTDTALPSETDICPQGVNRTATYLHVQFNNLESVCGDSFDWCMSDASYLNAPLGCGGVAAYTEFIQQVGCCNGMEGTGVNAPGAAPVVCTVDDVCPGGADAFMANNLVAGTQSTCQDSFDFCKYPANSGLCSMDSIRANDHCAKLPIAYDSVGCCGGRSDNGDNSGSGAQGTALSLGVFAAISFLASFRV